MFFSPLYGPGIYSRHMNMFVSTEGNIFLRELGTISNGLQHSNGLQQPSGQPQAGDILLAIDDVPLAEDGSIPFRDAERIGCSRICRAYQR